MLAEDDIAHLMQQIPRDVTLFLPIYNRWLTFLTPVLCFTGGGQNAGGRYSTSFVADTSGSGTLSFRLPIYNIYLTYLIKHVCISHLFCVTGGRQNVIRRYSTSYAANTDG
jgi:hypothetical protein